MTLQQPQVGDLQLRIIQANEQHAEQVTSLLVNAAEWMESQGIEQWKKEMFTPELIHSYFAEREVFLLYVDDRPVAMFTLQSRDPDYWQHLDDDRYLYLHRLTVHQDFRSLGLGAILIQWATNYALTSGKKGLRLDCMAHLPTLNRFYQSQDFRYMGTHDVKGRLASLYEKLPPTEDHQIRLEYFLEKDFEQLLEWSGDAKFLQQWSGIGWEYPLDTSDLEAHIEGANHPMFSDQLIYIVVDRITNHKVGHVALSRIDRTNRSARISKLLVGDPEARGKGYGRQILNELLRIGFDTLGMHRITLGVYDYNVSAIKLYESCGFSKEGLMRDSSWLDGQYYSVYEMSILEDEWRALQSRSTS